MSPHTAHGDNHKIGFLLLESGMITPEQLTVALKRQSESGERIGSVLLQLGYLSTDALLDFLHRHFGRPTIDLFHVQIDLPVLDLLSYDQMKQFQALPVSLSSQGVFVAMADPDDIRAVDALRAVIGRAVDPVVVPHSQLSAALRYIGQHGGRLNGPLNGRDVEAEQAGTTPTDTDQFSAAIRLLVEQKGSDLLLTAGLPPSLRINGETSRLAGAVWTPAELEKTARDLMTDQQWQRYTARGESEFIRALSGGGRFRISAYRQQGSVSLAIRPVAGTVPLPAELGLPEWLEGYVLKTRGLILVTAPAGHGRSTTLAALVGVINSRRRCNIITVEDPVEFLHSPGLSSVNQREVGRDTPSMHEGLGRILRQAPDVIVIDGVRDPESLAAALQAADAGRLVIAGMVADSLGEVIERIIGMSPQDQQHRILAQLAAVLLLVLNQRLIPRRGGGPRALAYGALSGSGRVRTVLREGGSGQIPALFQSAVADYHPIDVSLSALVRQGVISLDDGLAHCEAPAEFRRMVVSAPAAAGG